LSLKVSLLMSFCGHFCSVECISMPNPNHYTTMTTLPQFNPFKCLCIRSCHTLMLASPLVGKSGRSGMSRKQSQGQVQGMVIVWRKCYQQCGLLFLPVGPHDSKRWAPI
jgi:hypothetical protein